MIRHPLPISTRWFQAAILTYLVGFSVLGVLAYLVYQEQPPIPARTVTASGETLFTRDDRVLARSQPRLCHVAMGKHTRVGTAAGDVLFILGSATPLCWLCWRAVRYPNQNCLEEDTPLPSQLFRYETGDESSLI